MLGEVAHLDEVLAACGDADVVVLAADAIPAPGWLQQLAACLARDASIATATPWCNAGETASWPRIGEISAVPDDPQRLARACAAMPPLHPELPAAVGHAVALRGSARRRAGGLDAASYGSWYAALVDLSLRLGGLGWRNALCETAFVARGGEGAPSRRRPRRAGGALAGVACAAGAVPDGRSPARGCARSWRNGSPPSIRQCRSATCSPTCPRSRPRRRRGDVAGAEDPVDPGTQALPHVRSEEPIGE